MSMGGDFAEAMGRSSRGTIGTGSKGEMVLKGKVKKTACATLSLMVLLCLIGCQNTKTVYEDWFTYEAPVEWGDPIEISEDSFAYEPPDIYPFLTVLTNVSWFGKESSEEVFRSYFDDEQSDNYKNAEHFTIDGQPAMRGITTYADSDIVHYIIVFRTLNDTYVVMAADIESEDDSKSINAMIALSDSIKLTD